MDLKDKKLTRSMDDRMFAGVCAGLAEYFNMDPTIMRLIFVLVFFLGGGVSLLAYIILWIIMPEV